MKICERCGYTGDWEYCPYCRAAGYKIKMKTPLELRVQRKLKRRKERAG